MARWSWNDEGRSRRADRPLDVLLRAGPVLGAPSGGVDAAIGDVKEGPAQVSPALLRDDTIALALRRLGGYPQRRRAAEACLLRHGSGRALSKPGGACCRPHLISFAGYGVASGDGIRTIPRGHCVDFIVNRLSEARDILGEVQHKEPVLRRFEPQRRLAVRTGAGSGPGVG